jgi:membrane-bound inhibitor of C-type lysozyme
MNANRHPSGIAARRADAFKNMGGKIRMCLSIFSRIFGIEAPHQCGGAEGIWQEGDCLVNYTTPAQDRPILIALFLVAAAGAVARDPKPVHYTCADGTKLQAMFSPPSASMGSVKLVYARSSTETTLPQALSADGGRYIQGDVEFWIKGKGATLTRAGTATTCRTGN